MAELRGRDVEARHELRAQRHHDHEIDDVRELHRREGEQGRALDGKPAEPVWTTRLTGPDGPAQIAITGAAGTGEYRTLAAATQTQSPLSAK